MCRLRCGALPRARAKRALAVLGNGTPRRRAFRAIYTAPAALGHHITCCSAARGLLLKHKVAQRSFSAWITTISTPSSLSIRTPHTAEPLASPFSASLSSLRQPPRTGPWPLLASRGRRRRRRCSRTGATCRRRCSSVSDRHLLRRELGSPDPRRRRRRARHRPRAVDGPAAAHCIDGVQSRCLSGAVRRCAALMALKGSAALSTHSRVQTSSSLTMSTSWRARGAAARTRC